MKLTDSINNNEHQSLTGNQIKTVSSFKVVTEKPLNTRIENNYLRLILTLASSIAGFDIKKPYEAEQLIIDETGTKISKQTLANYLSKAH